MGQVMIQGMFLCPSEILYDEQGNLITLSQIVYFYWQNGRELEKVNLVGRDDFNVIDFKYDDEGIRTEKHTGTDVPRTYYTTEDGRITSQYIIDGLGQKSEEMIFLYDGDELVGAMHRGHQYYYLKNAMGDVIGVVNEDGQQIVSYAYNAWGKVVSKNVLVGGADVDYYFARYNPMLYRSYYYDDTLSMYYLQSRYYMPEICRFVNSDIPEIAQQSKDEVNGLNLFAYCNNNPVNGYDPNGHKTRQKAVKSIKTIANNIAKQVKLKNKKKFYCFYIKNSNINTVCSNLDKLIDDIDDLQGATGVMKDLAFYLFSKSLLCYIIIFVTIDVTFNYARKYVRTLKNKIKNTNKGNGVTVKFYKSVVHFSKYIVEAGDTREK